MKVKKPFRSTWGMTQDEWDEARDKMRALLTQIAQSRQTITYSECALHVFNGRFSPRSTALAQMLEEVCTIEDAEKGVMLGSVVVRKDSGIPGKGYFTFASDDLGREVGLVDMSDYSQADKRSFWEKEVARVWDRYQ